MTNEQLNQLKMIEKLDQIIKLLQPVCAHFTHLERIRNFSVEDVRRIDERIRKRAQLNKKT
jgi:hypothetical protein